MNKIIADPKTVASKIKTFFNDLSSKMETKAIEYSRNGDPFHNFNQGAIFTGQDPRVVLYGFMLKHLISLQDLINDIKANRDPEPSVLDEKAGDVIIYLALLRSMNNVVANGKLESISVKDQ